MIDNLCTFFTGFTVNGFPLWIVLLICVGVFLASFMDAIAGGGGIISVPTYLIAFTGLPTYYALGTNKLSAGIGTVFSTARFIKNGFVDWKLFAPSIVLALLGSMGGTWLQLHTPDVVLKYLLLVVLLICAGVFLASFMDAIAGGGGIISVPTYLIAFTGLPTYYALGTNKLSAGIGTIFSTARFIKNGFVDWKLFAPSIVLALLGSMGGTWLQLHTPDVVLKYLLLVVLPIVAFVTLRNREWPDEPGEIDFKKQAAIVWAGALVIGAYDGYYGPGTGTFLMLIFIRLAKLDTRHAAGGVKVINLSSNLGSLFTALMAGKVFIGVGLISAVASIAGHYIGAGLAIKNGSKIVRPTVIIVLILLTLKVGSELLFPEFWS